MCGRLLSVVALVMAFSESAQAQKSLVEVTCDLPASLVQPRSVLPFRVFLKNLTDDVIVLDRLRSLASPVELDLQFIELEPYRKNSLDQLKRRNVLAAHETRELAANVRLAPGKLPIQIRLQAAIPSREFAKEHLRPLGPGAFCLAASGNDPGRKPIEALHKSWLVVEPHPEVERLRAQLRVADFIAAAPHFGLLVRDNGTAYAAAGAQLTPLGRASLPALERIGRAFQSGQAAQIHVMPGAWKPGGCFERKFQSELVASDPSAPLSAAVRITHGQPSLRLSAQRADAFFECLRTDRLTLAEAAGELVLRSD